MKSTPYSTKTHFGLITKIGLVTLIAYVGLASAQAHQHGEAVTQKENAIELCSKESDDRRSEDELLEIVTTNKHVVSFYDTHQKHLSRGGEIKLTRVFGAPKKMKIKMKREGQRKWELNQKVTRIGNIKLKHGLLGDIISFTASTDVIRSKNDQDLHRYIFDFYVPCGYETVGYFMFDFWDINEKGEKIVRDENHKVILDPTVLFSHSRGTGGGQSN